MSDCEIQYKTNTVRSSISVFDLVPSEKIRSQNATKRSKTPQPRYHHPNKTRYYLFFPESKRRTRSRNNCQKSKPNWLVWKTNCGMDLEVAKTNRCRGVEANSTSPVPAPLLSSNPNCYQNSTNLFWFLESVTKSTAKRPVASLTNSPTGKKTLRNQKRNWRKLRMGTIRS